MPHVVWKGAISFGLVHVPVSLYAASRESGIDFDWLDKRSMDPVGYKRVNKRTGREIQGGDIVKGIKQGDGEYVVLSEDQIKAAYPKTTQTIAIETFVSASEIPFVLLETPYYLEPIGKADTAYALLRESMLESGVIGIARVVMHSKEHLAALIPYGAALILNTIRWANEIRPLDELTLPAEGKTAAGLKPAELKMATQLIANMTGPWKLEDYADNFSAAIHELIDKKLRVGDTETVQPVEEEVSNGASSNIVDLTKLLAESLAKRKPGSASPRGDTEGKAKAKTTRKAASKTTARKHG